MLKNNYIIKFIILLTVYFATAKFGLSLNAVSGFATLVWLPTGISLAAVLIFGIRLWPAIFLAAFLANLTQGAQIPVALGIAAGNSLEAVVAAIFLKRLGFSNTLERLQDVLLLVVAAIFSTMISATVGVYSLFLGGVTTITTTTWVAWWVGDMISDLVIAPFLLILSQRPLFSFKIKRIAEALILALMFILVGLGILKVIPGFFLAYIIFPVLIWASLSFKQRGAVTANFALAIAIILSNITGSSGEQFNEKLLQGQFFMATTSVVTLILAAIASEREKLEKRKDEFISTASHELKTPLATIKGYTQILNQFLKKEKNTKSLSYILKMDEQLDRLTKLVDDLLDVSRIQTGKLELTKERVNIDNLVKRTIEDMRLTIKHKIIFETRGKVKEVWVDKYYISEVLINLISNAIKYSPKADKIFVRTIYDGGVIVSVEDFGIGISKKDQDKVFERFFQADTKIRQSFSGLGLGLYISSEIIKKHGGSIWLESVKGKGSTVTFQLPDIK